MGITVRRMQPDDAPAVYTLFDRVLAIIPYYNDLAKAAERTKYRAEQLVADCAADPDAVLVAELDGAIVGYCISRMDDDLVWLSWFGADPDVRHRGVGSALLRELAVSAVRRGAHKVWCDTRTDNTRSQSVLVKADYVRVCELTNHWFGQDFYLWEKTLG